jgi:hypothetical protein
MQSCVIRAIAAVALVVAPTSLAAAPAHADCGDPGQPTCAGPVPSTDQVLAVLAELTDPGKPAAAKTDIVTPGFTGEESPTIDDHLNRMNAHGLLPLSFVVTNQNAPPGPIVLANHGGRWQLTHDTAMTVLNAIWSNANRHGNAYVPGAF